jgi:hypothetical protein
MSKLTTLTLAGLLTGCAAVVAPLPGDSRDAVRSRLGPPTSVYTSAAGESFEYATGPFGQTTWMARFDQDGKLIRYEQVLAGPVFASLKVGVATKQDVLHTLGRPAETSRVMLGNYEVWSYRYKENAVWDSMMHAHFDQAGVLRLMQSGPDPLYDRSFFRD